jgi:hypothetical protein
VVISCPVDFIGQQLLPDRTEMPAILFNVCFRMTASIEGILTQLIKKTDAINQ